MPLKEADNSGQVCAPHPSRRVLARSIERIAKEEIGITPDTALRLGRFFNTTPQFWMNFQLVYELEILANSLAAEIAEIEPIEAQAAAA